METLLLTVTRGFVLYIGVMLSAADLETWATLGFPQVAGFVLLLCFVAMAAPGSEPPNDSRERASDGPGPTTLP